MLDDDERKKIEEKWAEMLKNGVEPDDDSGEIARDIKHELFKIRTITTDRVSRIKNEQRRNELAMTIVETIQHLEAVIDALPVPNVCKRRWM